MAVAEEVDKYEEDMEKLIDTGKEKGYLTFGEVNDLLPGDITSPDELDDLMTTINTQGIDVLSGEGRTDRDKYEPEAGEESDDVELDLSPGTLEKTNDPVRMYLREMGTVPLLTREGEVEIAKRIERGQMRVMKAISRSPIVIREIVGLGEDLRRGVRNIKEVVTFDEEELTEEILQARVRATVGRIDVILKHQKKLVVLAEKLESPHGRDAKAKARDARKTRWLMGRERVYINRIVRELKYTNSEKKRLLDRVNKTVDAMRTLERQIKSLELKYENSKSEELRKEYRRGYKFSTYATWWIRQAITRAIADQARTIRIPVHMIETINKLIRTSRQLVQELGREASSEEIARRMDIPVAKVRKVLKIAQEPISLETPIGEEEDSHLGDFIEDRMAVSPADAVISVNLKEYTSQVLRTLTPREERVIKMRFGLEDGSEHTLEEVGQSFQVTRERIRQIEAKALRKLRHPSRSRKLKAFVDGVKDL